ncbi:MAG: DUF2231 domain-containing protein [Alphaproteobacteria bacterium]|jgi:uncharacterized membrane protein
MPNPKSTAQIAGHPFHPMLVTFPIGFLIGTFVSDLVYLWLGDAFWARVSFWLLAAGIAMALLAALAGLIDFLGDRSIRAIQIVWFHMIGNVTAVVLSLLSLWFRCRDGMTADYPLVFWISLIVVLILAVTGWLGGELVFRHRVGVAEEFPGPR